MNGKLHDREGNTMSARTRYSHKLFLQQLFFIIFHDVNFHALFVNQYMWYSAIGVRSLKHKSINQTKGHMTLLIIISVLFFSFVVASDIVHLTGDNFEHEVCHHEPTNPRNYRLHTLFFCSHRHKRHLEPLQEIGW